MGAKIRLPGKWLQIDSSILSNKTIEVFDLNDRKGRFKRLRELYDMPDDFLQDPETKVVYFSLGSMACAYSKLMKRLVDLLGKVPEAPPIKFIISKGPSDDISLPKNCVGSSFCPQIETLQCVDLMISHGG